MGSHTISLISMAAAGKGALLGCYRARTEHLSATPAVDVATDDAGLATMGGPCAALLGVSPQAPYLLQQGHLTLPQHPAPPLH